MRVLSLRLAAIGARAHGLQAPQRYARVSLSTALHPPRWNGSRRHRRPLCTKSPPAASPLPPPPRVVEELSDREMILRLLRRPQRTWLWLGGVVFAGVTLVAFGPELKVGVSKHTADVATKSLQDETLQSHTRELASQIVQTVLNDPNVLDQASRFIQRLVVMDNTRDAIRALVVYTLNDPTTLRNVTQLSRNLLTVLLEDPSTRDLVVHFLKQAMQDAETRAALIKLLDDLMHDPGVQKNLAQLLAETFGTDPVKHSVSSTIGESVHDVLSRQDIQNHAKLFVGSVVQDQTVQAQSGDAIWGTVMYAITPTWLSWIWEKNSEPEVVAVPPGAEAVVVAAVTSTPEGQAVLAETEEAFVEAMEKQIDDGAKPAVSLGDQVPAEEEEEEEVQREEEPEEDKKPPSRFEMLRRLTMRLPIGSSNEKKPDPSTHADALAPPDSSSSSKSKQQYPDSYEDHHWNGSGSGFL